MNPRISGRVGQTVKLDVTFRRGGEPADPFAIRRVDIYRTSPVPHNRVATFPVFGPNDDTYPGPAVRETEPAEAGACGTDPTSPTAPLPGRYYLPFDVPSDFVSPDVYFDVWSYYPTDPLSGSTDVTAVDLDDPSLSGALLSCCHRFWVYPDEWFCGDGLQTVNFGFEPMSQRFHLPERRPLEVGIMPLPLYDYNYNLVTPIIPYLTGTITIETLNNEVLVRDAPIEIGLRQGMYRSNPYVIRYMLDSTMFLIGTYKYRLLLRLPDGSTRSSKSFIFTVQ